VIGALVPSPRVRVLAGVGGWAAAGSGDMKAEIVVEGA